MRIVGIVIWITVSGVGAELGSWSVPLVLAYADLTVMLVNLQQKQSGRRILHTPAPCRRKSAILFTRMTPKPGCPSYLGGPYQVINVMNGGLMTPHQPCLKEVELKMVSGHVIMQEELRVAGMAVLSINVIIVLIGH